jgi:hypothetical protein
MNFVFIPMQFTFPEIMDAIKSFAESEHRDPLRPAAHGTDDAHPQPVPVLHPGACAPRAHGVPRPGRHGAKPEWPLGWSFDDLLLLIHAGSIQAADALLHFCEEAVLHAGDLRGAVGAAVDSRGNNLLHHLAQWPIVGTDVKLIPADATALHDKVTMLIHHAVQLGSTLTLSNVDGRTPAQVALLFGTAVTLRAILALGDDRDINPRKQPLLHLLAGENVYDRVWAGSNPRAKSDMCSKLFLLLHMRHAGDPREKWSFRGRDGSQFAHVGGTMSALELASATHQPRLAAEIYNVVRVPSIMTV